MVTEMCKYTPASHGAHGANAGLVLLMLALHLAPVVVLNADESDLKLDLKLR